MSPTKREVEARAIECAEHYASSNGYRGATTVVGLILAGMTIGARLPDGVRQELVDGYAEQFPQQDAVLDRWAERIAR